MKKRIVLTVVIFLFLFGTYARAGLFKIEEGKLPNGITVVTAEDNSSPVVTFEIFVDASKRKEDKGITGISHIAEHSFFLGSRKVPAGEFSKIVSKWGGTDNAYTGLDYTAYWASVPKDKLDGLAEMFADMLVNKALPPDAFTNEMKVIHEERRLTDNSPERSASLDFLELLYQGTRYAYPTLGYWEDLRKISLNDVKKYYEDAYSPKNMVCVVSGDVTHGESMRVVKKWFGSMKVTEPKIPKKLTPSVQSEERRQIKEREGQKSDLVYIGFPTFEFDHPDYFPVMVMTSILSDGDSSRFKKSIIKEKKLATYAETFLLETKEKGAIVIQAEPLQGIAPSVLERNIYSELEKIKSYGVTKDEVDKVVENARKDFVTDLQSTKSRAEMVGMAYILSNKKFRYLDEYLDNLKKVTPEDVLRVAKKYLADNARSVFIQIPRGNSYWGTKVSDLKTKEFKTSKMISFRNGLNLYYTYSKKVPALSVEFMVFGGSSNDPSGREGVANLTATLLTKGTKKRDEESLAKELDQNAIDLGAGASVESVTIGLNFLKEKSDLAFDILSDIAKNLIVKEEVFQRERERLLSSIESNKSVPGYVGDVALSRILFEGEGLANPVSGLENSLRKIGTSDINAFYKRYFNSGNTTISVAGDIELDYLVDLIGEKFADYRSGETNRDIVGQEPKVKGTRYYVIDMPWLTQSYIFAGGKGISRSDSSFNSVRIMNYILGGSGFASRLMDNLRAKMGLAYSVYSSFVPYRNTGFFKFAIQTKTESTRKAIEAFFGETDKFGKEGATKEEFLNAKSFYEGNLPFKMETISQKAFLMSQGIFYGIGPDFYLSDVEEIKGFKPDDINREAKRVLSRDLAIVIVGKKDEILRNLSGLGDVKEIKLETLY